MGVLIPFPTHLTMLAKHRPPRRGASWITCTVCPPWANGDLHQHYTGARNALARAHLLAMRVTG